jgi:succinate dehydrogenase/fumarate reductase flavoprotein subunit
VNDAFDIVVVGAGAAGLTAAAVAAAAGQRVLLLEHTPWVGGTTAISGGMVWVPANHKMAQLGLADSADAARTYLRHTVLADDDASPLDAFVAQADDAIRHLEAHTALRLQPVLRYPDYYPELPGATAGGRVLEPVPFDARMLGAEFARLRLPLPEFTLFGGMMIHRSDMPHLRRALRSPAAAAHVARLLARHAIERTRAPRGTTLHLGNALAGWLFKSVLDLGVTLRTGARVERLLREHGRVSGLVIIENDRAPRSVIARKAVVLASGGISHDTELRGRHVPAAVGSLSAVVPSGARSGAALALEVGAQLSRGVARQGLWVPVSIFTRPDGSRGVFPHTVTDRGKPGLIAVDGRGRRFVNEALSYHEFVKAQLKADAIPAFLLCDRRFLWRYGLGCVKPLALSVQRLVDQGYLKRASTLDGLARAIGAPADALQQTVARFNDGARRGIDEQFGRGSDIYQRHLGDPDHRPNPCVVPIEHAPFFAVEVRPADLGMAAGLITDASARVLDADNRPIAGLYACGNDMQSVMNGAYPGPGITLGPALVFGVIAARRAIADSMGSAGDG